MPPAAKADWRALLLLPALLLAGLWMAGDAAVWATLTIAGLGMGGILFMLASGLTLVFGLMGVMNFAHGMLMTLGAVAGSLVLSSGLIPALRLWYLLDHPLYNLLAIVGLAACSMVICVVAGLAFERLLIRPARDDLLKQIMLTATGAMMLSEMLEMIVGRGVGFRLPPNLNGSYMLGDVVVVKMPLLLIVVGLAVWAGLHWLLHRTRFGLLLRAAVEQREMVEAMGYRAERLFVATFSLGVALAALAGLLFGMQQASVPLNMGQRMLPLIFLVLTIGGLGSMSGTLLAAILLSLVTNYVGYAYPALTAFSGILLALAVLLWRPHGLYPLNKS
jgi:branched-chain amino acid transport system permease protein